MTEISRMEKVGTFFVKNKMTIIPALLWIGALTALGVVLRLYINNRIIPIVTPIAIGGGQVAIASLALLLCKPKNKTTHSLAGAVGSTGELLRVEDLEMWVPSDVVTIGTEKTPLTLAEIKRELQSQREKNTIIDIIVVYARNVTFHTDPGFLACSPRKIILCGATCLPNSAFDKQLVKEGWAARSGRVYHRTVISVDAALQDCPPDFHQEGFPRNTVYVVSK